MTLPRTSVYFYMRLIAARRRSLNALSEDDAVVFLSSRERRPHTWSFTVHCDVLSTNVLHETPGCESDLNNYPDRIFLPETIPAGLLQAHVNLVTAEGHYHEIPDHLLRHVKLPAAGRRSGGRTQTEIRGRCPDRRIPGRSFRSGNGREADLFKEETRTVSRRRRD